MSTVTLSAAVRSNLLSLQRTASLLDRTQTRLATGNKVNSALDYPTSYFTAASLNARASDLGNLLDSVSNAIQTIQAANDGITSITKLVESAQSTANQAQQLSATVGAAGTTATASTNNLSSVAISNGLATPATLTSAPYVNLNLGTDATNAPGGNEGWQFDISIDGSPNTFYVDTIQVNQYNFDNSASLDSTNLSAQDVADIINNQIAGLASVVGGAVVLKSGTSGSSSTLNITSVTLYSGNLPTSGSLDFSASLSDVGSDAGTDTTGTITINGQNVTLANGDDSAAILGKLQSAATAAGTGSNAFSVSNSSGVLTLTGANGNDLAISGNAATLAALGLSSGTIDGVPAGGPNPARGALISQYNGLLDQIDQLTADAGFNGNNLLAGTATQLKVVFNESGTSSLTIGGKDTSATGLGLAQLTAGTEFDTNASITTILGKLKTAQDTLRADSSSFGSQLSIVQTRQDFTKALINTLQTGASNLTLADSNEEAANLLALQTRQSLSTKALSLASQGDQNVLRLLQ